MFFVFGACGWLSDVATQSSQHRLSPDALHMGSTATTNQGGREAGRQNQGARGGPPGPSEGSGFIYGSNCLFTAGRRETTRLIGFKKWDQLFLNRRQRGKRCSEPRRQTPKHACLSRRCSLDSEPGPVLQVRRLGCDLLNPTALHRCSCRLLSRVHRLPLHPACA